MLKAKDSDQKFKYYFIIFFLLLISVFFFKLISGFIVPAILAMAFCSLLYPIYQKILKKVNNKKNLASLVTCLLLVVVLIIPASILIYLLSQQTYMLYNTVQPLITKISHMTQQDFFRELRHYKFYNYVERFNIDWLTFFLTIGNKALALITILLDKFSQSLLNFTVNLIITFFCMFYFFRDGDKFLKYLEEISPLQKEHEQRLFDNFIRTSRATVKGTILIGLLQGSLGALTLLFFGIKTWILWGFIMIICAIIPVVGAWVVLVPISIFMMLTGHLWQGVAIFLISTIIISNIDNLVRPYLVGKDAKMHDLIIFFSTIGGIGVFGIMGFVIGPVIAALFLALLTIYKDEFQDKIS